MTADPGDRVTAVVVAHDSGAVIGACLPALLSAREIIVVDNASTDDTVEAVERAAPKAAIVKIGDNNGFGAAANEGLRRATGEFVLIVAPEAQLMPGALEALVAAADRYSRAGLLSPVLLNAEGRIEHGHDVSLMERDGMPRRRADPPPEGDLCAGYLPGAVMLLRKRAIDEIGHFDDAIFLGHEDDDVCLRLVRAGWSLVLVPEAQARRIGGPAAWSWEAHWRKSWHMAWSRLYLERKYRSAKAARREGARALFRYAGKAVAGFFRSDQVETVRDLACFCGTAGFLLGLKGRGF